MSDLTGLRSSERLLESLGRATARGVSKADVKEQRVSFIYGQIRDKAQITREQIREILARSEGDDKR